MNFYRIKAVANYTTPSSVIDTNVTLLENVKVTKPHQMNKSRKTLYLLVGSELNVLPITNPIKKEDNYGTLFINNNYIYASSKQTLINFLRKDLTKKIKSWNEAIFINNERIEKQKQIMGGGIITYYQKQNKYVLQHIKYLQETYQKIILNLKKYPSDDLITVNSTATT